MKKSVFSVFLLAIVVSLVFASVASATSQATIDEILKDAADGTLDGNWSKADVEAALAYLEANPLQKQYSDVEAVLEAYLAGSAGPDVASGGDLAFTGVDILIALGSGIGLIGGGLFLRRRGS
jgi:hypothetical protein